MDGRENMGTVGIESFFVAYGKDKFFIFDIPPCLIWMHPVNNFLMANEFRLAYLI
jgi:hypothetical protein